MPEKILTFFFLLISSSYLYFAKQLTFGNLQSPRSGFLPILVGIAAIIISCFLLFKQRDKKQSTTENSVDWTKFIFILIGFIFYITLFHIIGYFFTTFIVLFYLFKIADMSGWILPLSVAFGSSASFYLLFKYYLAVALP